MAFDLSGKAVKRFRLPVVDYINAPIIIVYAQQGDIQSRYFEVTLYDDDGDVDLSQYIKATLNGTTPTGDILSSELFEFTENHKSVIVQFSGGFTATPGRVACDIVFTNSDASVQLTSQTFYVIVSQSQTGKVVTENSEDYNQLLSLIQDVKDLKADYEETTARVDEVVELASEALNNASEAVNNANEAAEQAIAHTVKSMETKYQYGDSGTVPPSGEWLSNPPAPNGKEFFWSKTVFTFMDGTEQEIYTIGRKGDKGDQGSSGTIQIPEYGTAQNGKVLGVVEGTLAWVDRVVVSVEENTAGGNSYSIKA